MPMYDYRCTSCGYEFTETHGFDETVDECPECEEESVERVIKGAPTIARGAMTHAGDGRKATKKELKDKWREETPKLRKKLYDKLGPDAVEQIPSLNMEIKDDDN